MIVSGLVGNPEASSVHRRSSTSINQSPNSKFLGLSLSTTSLINAYYCVKTQSHTVDTMSSPVARCSLFSTSVQATPPAPGPRSARANLATHGPDLDTSSAHVYSNPGPDTGDHRMVYDRRLLSRQNISL